MASAWLSSWIDLVHWWHPAWGHIFAAIIGPPEGIEVRFFNQHLDCFDILNFGYVEIVDMAI